MAEAQEKRLQKVELFGLKKRRLWGSSLVPASTYREDGARLLEEHSDPTGKCGSKGNSSWVQCRNKFILRVKQQWKRLPREEVLSPSSESPDLAT